MGVKEYALKFTQLSRYAPTMVAGERMSMFVSGMSEMVVNKCCTPILINDMDISHLMVHAQNIEEDKLKEGSREAKRANTGDGNFSHSKTGGHGRPKL